MNPNALPFMSKSQASGATCSNPSGFCWGSAEMGSPPEMDIEDLEEFVSGQIRWPSGSIPFCSVSPE
ncbi:MAG: hypothetical protein JWN14_353 [Chthonomonadales bacterium]|nr:hypothetical protein [Chthonomonadales bacterium]